MRSSIYTFIIVAFVAITSWFSIYSLQPLTISNLNEKPENFSTLRAYAHVKKIAQEPHYVGSENHSDVRNYLIDELEELGLTVQTQKGFSLSKASTLTIPENIITRIEGTDNKQDALLLLSHYDSAVHSSYGASDAASGVATILETLRAFKAKGKKPKNDIIILFSDAEEVGLNGARLFAEEHPWANDVQLVLNFESRGSGGPSNMIIETNHGNRALINSFSNANPDYPVASSLMYNIYKLLPNDTDSTVFREELDIPSFFFAFIDDHFDYHTARDIPQNLDKRSLAHQGSYLQALLDHFADTDFNQLKSKSNKVYFNFPFIGVISYPYTLSPYLLIFAFFLLIVGLFYGIKKNKLSIKETGKGFLAFSLLLLASFIIGYGGWYVIELLYPHYSVYLQGFTPNGYYYLLAFVLFVISAFFLIYSKFFKYLQIKNGLVAPITYWLLICLLIQIYLPGGAFFTLPLILTLAIWLFHLKFRRFSLFFMMLILSPILFMLVPYVSSFPVGLGLSSIYISCVLTTLIMGSLLSLILPIRNKKSVSFSALILSIAFFLVAHFNSQFNKNRPKPNSLVYFMDSSSNKAFWKTYDTELDEWTKPHFKDKRIDTVKASFASKYNEKFTYSAPAKYHDIPLTRISTSTDDDLYSLEIRPINDANRISLFNKSDDLVIEELMINDKDETQFLGKDRINAKSRLLTYFVVDDQPVKVSIRARSAPKIQLITSSYSLLNNKQLGVRPRPEEYMPKPFVLTDVMIYEEMIEL